MKNKYPNKSSKELLALLQDQSLQLEENQRNELLKELAFTRPELSRAERLVLIDQYLALKRESNAEDEPKLIQLRIQMGLEKKRTTDGSDEEEDEEDDEDEEDEDSAEDDVHYGNTFSVRSMVKRRSLPS